jgi:pilus assembly protein CpaC
MNRWVVARRISLFCLLILFTFCFVYATDGWGEDLPRIALKTTPSQKLNLTVGKSTILQSPEPIKRVSLASPEIADAMVLTQYQIYLMGKAPGLTNLSLWGTDDNVTAIVDLDVCPDLSRLKEVFYKLLPEEKDIKVTATHDHITLTGTVSSASTLSQILSLAGPYAPMDQQKKPKIINLLEVAGVHQVMLEVRVSEMSRSLLRRLGFNFNYITSNGASLGLGMLNKLTSLPAAGFPSSGIRVSDSVNAIFRFMDDGTTWTVFIDALKEEGLLKVLAEPTLITLSGKTASFLAGGEFPIPVPQSTGGGGTTITIEYKPFGIGLNFTPTVLANKKIGLQVAPEVSDVDFTNAITTSGFVVPALITRRVSTAIELADGQSFAIAGLLKEDVREIVSKYPVLGDIPILGSLFRSSSFKKNETELIVIVTAHLVKPLDLTKQTLPTDAYVEPDDFEFYLLGTIEGKKGLPKKGGFEGDFGHTPPR